MISTAIIVSTADNDSIVLEVEVHIRHTSRLQHIADELLECFRIVNLRFDDIACIRWSIDNTESLLDIFGRLSWSTGSFFCSFLCGL